MNAEPDLPSWTSQAVAALGPAQAELLGRLTSEPRMKRVWREFGRRRRSDGARRAPEPRRNLAWPEKRADGWMRDLRQAHPSRRLCGKGRSSSMGRAS